MAPPSKPEDNWQEGPGDGWWRGSDGNWYPPGDGSDKQPEIPPPPPPPPASPDPAPPNQPEPILPEPPAPQSAVPDSQPEPEAPIPDRIAALSKLGDLYEKGLLSDAEFAAAKSELLAESSPGVAGGKPESNSSSSRLGLIAVAGVAVLVAVAVGSLALLGVFPDSQADGETLVSQVVDESVEEPAQNADLDRKGPLGDGSLGTVVVEPGAQVQIRSLNAISGDVAFLGVPNQRSVEAAVADFGDIKGFEVTSGVGLDDLCSAEGGQAAAQQIVADEQVVGVIGTSCSGAAFAAAPLISDAGLVMISGSNTSPVLTSDLAGTAGDGYSPGYYRTSHNDLYQSFAMAEFVYNDLGLATAAAIHDGDPYTEGLARAFADAFEALGGWVTGLTGVDRTATDLVPVLTEVAAGSPEALFFPVFQPVGDFIADQAPGVAGLENTQLLAADGLLYWGFMELPQSEGLYFSGPDVRFGSNTNQSTGKSAWEVLADYEAAHGEPPSAAFWGHSYDAAAMLLDAIDAASYVDGDGNLVIDRAGVREALNGVSGYSGLIGTISCDNFGDCGSQKITVVHHTDSTMVDAGMSNVVFEYAP